MKAIIHGHSTRAGEMFVRTVILRIESLVLIQVAAVAGRAAGIELIKGKDNVN